MRPTRPREIAKEVVMLKQGTRVLLTGGAGFIGAAVARALISAGCSVRVLDDLSTGRRDRLLGLGSTLELLHADVRNPATVRSAAKGAHAIVHLAGVPAGGDPALALEVNVGGTLNVLVAAREMDKKERPRVLLCGSGGVYGRQQAFVLHEELQPRPATPEAVMALSAEAYGRVYREAFGVPVTTLRLFRTFGPEEDGDRPDASVVARFVRAAVEGKAPIIFGDGQQTRDLVYIDNVVAAILAALKSEPVEVLNVASGEAVSINFLWNLVLEQTGKRRRAIEPTYLPAQPWDPSHARPQIARACKVLGWAPSVRLRDGIARTVYRWLEASNADPNAWFTPRDRTPTPALRSPATPRHVPLRAVAARAPAAAAPPAVRPPPLPTPREELLEMRDIEIVEERVRELDIEWAPVPVLPWMDR
jgi:nucleoside-diphosphate-sugar epimerase